MTVRFLADEDLRDSIIQGLRSREPALDILDVKSAGLRGTKDPVLLEIAAEQNRIVITQDRNTMTALLGTPRSRKVLAGLVRHFRSAGCYWRRNRMAASHMDGVPIGRVAGPDCLRTRPLILDALVLDYHRPRFKQRVPASDRAEYQ